MATIIKSNKELTKRESYKLTLDPAIKKMKDYIGVQIDTFKRDFMNIAELMDGEEYTIEVISGQSKAGREFITCTLV